MARKEISCHPEQLSRNLVLLFHHEGQAFAPVAACLSQCKRLLLYLYNVQNSRDEKVQNLNAREGALGKSKAEASQWFRHK